MDDNVTRHRIRLYRRLRISQVDLWQAELLAERLADDPPADHLLRDALTVAAVVSYARPFTNNDSQAAAHPGLPKGWARAYTPPQRELHARILEARDKEVAHSDTAVHEVSFTLGDTSTMTEHRVRSPLRGWGQAEAAAFLVLIRRLREWVDDQTDEARAGIPPGHYPHRPEPNGG